MLALAVAATLALASSALAETTITAAPSPSQVAKAKRAETSPQPLTDYSFSYGQQPYQVRPLSSSSPSLSRPLLRLSKPLDRQTDSHSPCRSTRTTSAEALRCAPFVRALRDAEKSQS